MSFQPPVLDDRTFQQIVDEVKKRIPLYCPEWTDHNVSDPGVTLIELFAWMTEMLIYRLNQVPELHYRKFAEFLGLQQQPPRAATTMITFWLSKGLAVDDTSGAEGNDAASSGPLTRLIAADTQLSTTQTETTEPIIFTTDRAFTIHAPRLQTLRLDRKDPPSSQSVPQRVLQELRDGLPDDNGYAVFSDEPVIDEALYFGFQNDLSYHILQFDFVFDEKAGIGINVKHPPYVWEAYSEKGGWEKIEAYPDTTRGMNAQHGNVVLHLPQLRSWDPTAASGNSSSMAAAYWVRVRIKEITAVEAAQGMRAYNRTPELLQIKQVAAVGCIVRASQCRTVNDEQIGISDGSPGQRFRLSGSPVLLPMRAEERLRVELKDQQSYWEHRSDFSESDRTARHFVIDSMTGELRLGPTVRQPTGEMRRYGAIPPREATLILERYRYGGGTRGNLPKGAINVLRSSIPYVASVENRVAATGGLDEQPLEDLELSVQRLLRTRHVAVAPEDFQAHVMERFANEIDRVHCIPLRRESDPKDKDGVRLLVIPRLAVNGSSAEMVYLPDEVLEVDASLREEILDYLEQFRLLTYKLVVEKPRYQRVKATVDVTVRPEVDREPLRILIHNRLQHFFHPTTGGLNGRGRRFGKPLTIDEVEMGLADLRQLDGIRVFDVVALEFEEDERKTTDVEQTPLPLAESEMLVSAQTHVINIRT
ncbi:MAG TPA: putative baseplate assembly protein [Caldilineaceae bacterium]|nr:putative baseplate assembly protein [Caldilineaceae bacterium]